MTDLIKLQTELIEIKKKKEKAIEEHEFEMTALLRDREKQLLQLIQDNHPSD